MNGSAVHLPRSIYYGQGSFERVGEEAAKLGQKALIISDNVMRDLGNVERCHRYLEQAKVDYVDYSDIVSEPTDQYVNEALQLKKIENCDIVIALGGGSCIDTAKAVAVLATNSGDISDYMNFKTLVKNKPLPLIAIPTTAGTGSEATDVTVITNTSNDVKMMIKQPAFMPEIAIVDPVLALSSPQKTTAATGVDALTHAIEAYISKKAHPFTDQLALSAIKLITENILESYHNGANVEAREKMIYASMQAGIAFSNSSVCLVHGMSRPLGALFHVPHGISNAMLLPVVLHYSKESCIDRLAQIGRYVYQDLKGISDREVADILVSNILTLCRDLDIPNLKTWGVKEDQFNRVLEKMARDALESGSPGNNPKVPTESEIISLYREAFAFEYSLESHSKTMI
ncbi:iron-containing alcohol dehydrogenase [Halalkalibacter nanhaiisediminis]|uniref:Alcohol dehydrogenase/1,3-propanediol dehydrogenase n=1 Tax=Halalkalibacter nanhaiisediminis TaxID=688079 RepID=A0A562QHM6_9BACI|nr:iron-containing alcohol dehydrogenase [Halalkalibacter nanhaiisediminis]TWI56239.1 alcohol dehydrogenase/1,3-propanediol dehydrogenase [Halalkalibacter nanhaiisediminis]